MNQTHLFKQKVIIFSFILVEFLLVSSIMEFALHSFQHSCVQNYDLVPRNVSKLGPKEV